MWGVRNVVEHALFIQKSLWQLPQPVLGACDPLSPPSRLKVRIYSTYQGFQSQVTQFTKNINVISYFTLGISHLVNSFGFICFEKVEGSLLSKANGFGQHGLCDDVDSAAKLIISKRRTKKTL